jgi:inhibitor of cysteine peptidase
MSADIIQQRGLGTPPEIIYPRRWEETMKRRWFALLSFAAVISLAASAALLKGSGPKKQVFDQSKSGSKAVVEPGEVFRIELYSNPTTGYQWKLQDLDASFLKLAALGRRHPKNKKLVGAGGTAWWDLQALKPGKTSLRMVYFRPWEGPDKAASEFRLDLSIESP